MKQCRKCGELKKASEYYKNTANSDGLQSYCRTCHLAYVRERNKKPRTDEQRAKARTYARMYRYGVNAEQYEKMLAEQDGSCAVCRVEFSETVKPNVDHDHKCCPGILTCGKCVRGLLCGGCNSFANMIETRFHTHEDMFKYLHLHHNSRWGSINLTEQDKINTNSQEVN